MRRLDVVREEDRAARRLMDEAFGRGRCLLCGWVGEELAKREAQAQVTAHVWVIHTDVARDLTGEELPPWERR